MVRAAIARFAPVCDEVTRRGDARASVELTQVARTLCALAAARLVFCLGEHSSLLCSFLRVTALVLQPASRGVAVGCVVLFFASFGREGEI